LLVDSRHFNPLHGAAGAAGFSFPHGNPHLIESRFHCQLLRPHNWHCHTLVRVVGQNCQHLFEAVDHTAVINRRSHYVHDRLLVSNEGSEIKGAAIDLHRGLQQKSRRWLLHEPY